MAQSTPNLNAQVGESMRQDFPKLLPDLTVGEALHYLRSHPVSGPIVYFYVLDSDGILRGVVPSRHLLLEPYERKLSDLMIRNVITIPTGATSLQACRIFLKHKFLALPVVDDHNRMVGLVDLSLYTDELSQITDSKKQDDLFQLIGVHVSNANPISSFSAFRSRFPWLGCNLGAGVIAAFLSGVYQKELSQVVALTFFIPVVLNLAESVSSQSVSLALELLHGKLPAWSTMFSKIRREVFTGLFLGVGSGLIVALVGLFWLGEKKVALCLLGGISGGVTGAALLGMLLPYFLRLMSLEPQVAAGPIALAGADIITLTLYLNLARWLLQ